MPALPNRVLFSKLASALPDGTRFETRPEEVHPGVAVVPGFGRTRLYLWTVTADRSEQGRPAGEFKIQLILPGQPKVKGPRGSLDLEGAYAALLGYSPDFGVFVGWEARLYQRFAYSRNVQCREELLKEARNSGWAVAPPRRAGGSEEVRVAFTPGNLLHYLRTSRTADTEDKVGKWREAYFLAQTPNVRAPLPTRARDLDEQVERQRQRVAATRFVRDAKFSACVRQQYDYACAVCELQLEVVEGAHIIPVCEPGSSDEVWNGVALCPNHHELFDGNTFVIEPALQVRVDDDRVEYLEENDLANGIEILTDFAGKTIRPPHFWTTDADMRDRMRGALERRATLAGLA
jgi:putative restriction endonuclease